MTAEYAMLPRSTNTRSDRERRGPRGRTQEIQRLIGRSLRAATSLDDLGEHTIIVDCDVLVADGGTRTASITGACLALEQALDWLRNDGRIDQPALGARVAAVSVGIVGGVPCLDLDYVEDSSADSDFNLVALEDGRFVEVQGTAEEQPFSGEELNVLLEMGAQGIHSLILAQQAAIGRKP